MTEYDIKQLIKEYIKDNLMIDVVYMDGASVSLQLKFIGDYQPFTDVFVHIPSPLSD